MNIDEIFYTVKDPVQVLNKTIYYRYYVSLKPYTIREEINRNKYIELTNRIADINGFGWIKKKGLFNTQNCDKM